MKHLPADQVPADFVPCEGRLSADTDLWKCFESIAIARPDKLAMDDGQRRLSYRDCLESITQLSRRLQAPDVGRDQISIVLMDTGINSALTMLAHIRAGIVFVPIDTAISTDRIRVLFESCHPAMLVTESKYLSGIQNLSNNCHLILVDQTSVTDSDAELPPNSHETVCRLLTSGSTGTPKQIIYTRKMILHDVCIRTDSLKISPSDRFSQWIGGTSLPLMTLFLSVLNGASLHIHDIHSQGLQGLPDWIRENEITILRLTPTLLRLFMQQNPKVTDLSSVRLVSTGGEALMADDIDRFRQIFPQHAALLNHLSATEYRVACQYFVDRETEFAGPQIPVGFPVKDFEIAIVDDSGDPLPDGEIGEIAIRSAFISPGYIVSDTGEMRRFEMTPDGYYLSGDLGLRRADQCIEHHGRKDRMTKIRGIRIQLDEVEAVLSALDGVDKAVALLLTSPDGEPLLVVCVVEQTRLSVSLNQIRQTLYSNMGLFGLPHYLEKRDRLPLTVNGKIDRLELQNELQVLYQASDAKLK